MNADFQRLMNDATQLTRSGDLAAATAILQRALAGAAGTEPPDDETLREIRPETDRPAPSHRRPAGMDAHADVDAAVIDVQAREIVRATGANVDEVAPRAPIDSRPAAAPVSERFVAGEAVTRFGTRNYKLYVPPMPSQAGAGPRPLLLMLHGCTQNPDDFARGTAMNDAARDRGFYVLYPAQSTAANPQGCWNWFKHTHQQRDRGEPALLAAMTRQVMATHAIDPKRVYVAGLSAGGAMAAILAHTHPDLFAAAGVHSGLAAGAASNLPAAMAAMQNGSSNPAIAGSRGTPVSPAAHRQVPVIVFHGDADRTVHPANGDQIIRGNVDEKVQVQEVSGSGAGNRRFTRRIHRQAGSGQVVAEQWTVHGAGHAWSGGRTTGSFADSSGPDASAEMLRFFSEQTLQD
ncbi:MAG: PHB depolymerase family esterase [Variovorax sp.]